VACEEDRRGVVAKGDRPDRWLPWLAVATVFRIDFGPGPRITTAARFRELVEKFGDAAVVEYWPDRGIMVADLYGEPEPL